MRFAYLIAESLATGKRSSKVFYAPFASAFETKSREPRTTVQGFGCQNLSQESSMRSRLLLPSSGRYRSSRVVALVALKLAVASSGAQNKQYDVIQYHMI